MNKRIGSVQLESEVFQSPVQHLAKPSMTIALQEVMPVQAMFQKFGSGIRALQSGRL